MDKAEALRVAVLLTDTYDELEYSYKMGFGIPLKYDYMPGVVEVSNLANFIINTEDENLYVKTFEKIDSTILHKILGILSTKWLDIDERDREEYENGIFGNLQVKGCFEYLHNLVSTYEFFHKVYEEMNMLRAIFKTFRPPHPKEDASAQSNIFEYMRTTKKKRLKDALHKYIDGNTGKTAILPLYVAVKLNLMSRPKYIDFIAEFGSIIKESAYSKAMNHHKFDPTEVEKMERIFNPMKQ